MSGKAIINGAIVALDFEKAFDRVYRPFLYSTLKKLNFSDNFISIIKLLSEIPYATMNFNGKMGKSFKTYRGIKQGCPLAMYSTWHPPYVRYLLVLFLRKITLPDWLSQPRD